MTNAVLVVWDVAELPLRDLSALLRASDHWALGGGSPPTASPASPDNPVDAAPRAAEPR
jgi:hypothetical protein